MIKINNLPKITKKANKRIGRGHGSGKVKTSGRGTKGQKSRGSISKRLGFAGASLIKRLPLYRGKYRNKPIRKKALVVNLKYLNHLPKNTIVDISVLDKFHIINGSDAKKYGVKILGDGEITVPLTIKISCSKGAVKKIEKAGGKVVAE